MRLRSLLLSAALAPVIGLGVAVAAEPDFAGVLPEPRVAVAALDASAELDRARAQLDQARAQSRALAVGEHEFVVSATAVNRPGRPGADYGEFTVDIARAVRLPGKARLDRVAGAEGVSAAEDSVDDARHQMAIRLTDAWFAWVDAAETVRLDRAAVANAEQEVSALARRVELQDASVLDREQGDAALAAARSRLAQSEGGLEAARVALARGFPALPLPAAPPVLPAPQPLARDVDAWRTMLIANSHEIRIAEHQARQAEALAARARLDRRPDPTLGVRLFSEQGGREQGAGVFVSTPLGGARRSAVARSEAARASVARADLARVRRDVSELADRDIAAVLSDRAAWTSASAAVQAQEAALARTRRGFELGELDLAGVLLAERQAYEARRAEITARTAAWRAAVRLSVDAHVLWAGEEESEGAHVPPAAG
jgi:outer membrane protein TolC